MLELNQKLMIPGKFPDIWKFNNKLLNTHDWEWKISLICRQQYTPPNKLFKKENLSCNVDSRQNRIQGEKMTRDKKEIK